MGGKVDEASGVAVDYFDGRSSRRLAATLRIVDGRATVEAGGQVRADRLDAVDISEPMGDAPRTLSFGDGAFCEVRDREAFAALLARQGLRESAVVRWQSRWRVAAASLAGVAAFLAAVYFWLLPLAAEALAPLVPASVAEAISTTALRTLDERLLQPSKLSAERRERIAQGFARVHAAAPEPAAYRLHFRAAPAVGPNAFALPSGDIVLFDELVALAADDAEVVAVLAHELGHVRYRHGMRQLLQSAVVSFVVGAYLGDLSTVVAGLTTLVLESNYSRDFEYEADRYGGLALIAGGGSAEPLARILGKLDAHRRGKPGETGDRQATPGGDILSTHPDTVVRQAALRALRPAPGKLSSD